MASIAHPPAPMSRSGKIAVSVTLILASVLLLFSRLGHYALWDDESYTALAARGILRTGDTTAVLDHNLVAYANGSLLWNLHDRSTPPLPAYLAALSMAVFGDNALAARLPFALCGFAFVLLVMRWLWRDDADVTTWSLVTLGVLGNVSLFLFFRQCRYYAPALLATAIIVRGYAQGKQNRRQLFSLAAVSVVLFASNYLNYAALYACLALDYLCWGRRVRRLSRGDWVALLLPQLLIGGSIFTVWNSFRTGFGQQMSGVSPGERLGWIWLYVRDTNLCEFGVVWLLVAAPMLHLIRPNPCLLRLPLALGVYTVAIALLSPVRSPDIAQVRYLAPTIPFWIWLSVVFVRELSADRRWLALPLGAMMFMTNLAELSWLFPSHVIRAPVRSTLQEYVGELLAPPPDPYTLVAQWINREIPPDATVCVMPTYMSYPLMYHAPGAVYAWQLDPPPRGQFRDLSPVYFRGQVAPDYLIAFGPAVQELAGAIVGLNRPDLRYTEVKSFRIFWHDLYRPELFLRVFKPVEKFDPQLQGIHIFKRTIASG